MSLARRHHRVISDGTSVTPRASGGDCEGLETVTQIASGQCGGRRRVRAGSSCRSMVLRWAPRRAGGRPPPD
jgi:hypothetical protein